MRGYCGIGVVDGKYHDNIAGIFRSAQAFGIDFLFLTREYKNLDLRMDTTNARDHMPIFNIDSPGKLKETLPNNCKVVAVETLESARTLGEFVHPEQACYILGHESKGLSEEWIEASDQQVVIPSEYCLNVHVSGSIVLYDRIRQMRRNRRLV